MEDKVACVSQKHAPEFVKKEGKKMNTLKKIGLGILSLGMVIGLTACGGSQDTGTITFATWASSPAEDAAMDNTIAAFTAETGIKVNKEVIADKYMDVMKSRFAAKSAPDAFYVDALEAPGLMQSGVLENLDSALENKDDFYPAFLKTFQDADGKTFGLPKDYSTLSLYINKDMFEAAGVDPATIPTDYTAFVAFAKELQTKLPAGTASMVVEKDLARHLSAIEATGATVIKEDGTVDFASNPSVETYLKTLTDGHADKYFFAAKEDLGADWAGAAFGTNKAAMMFEGNWVLSAMSKDFPTVNFESRELPTMNGKKHTMAFTVGYGVSKDSKNKENATKFIQYMTNQGQKQWATESGTLPTRKSVEAEMNLPENAELKSHIAGAEYATVWSRGVTLPLINTNFGNQFLSAFNGETDIRTAIEKIDSITNEEIRKQA